LQASRSAERADRTAQPGIVCFMGGRWMQERGSRISSDCERHPGPAGFLLRVAPRLGRGRSASACARCQVYPGGFSPALLAVAARIALGHGNVRGWPVSCFLSATALALRYARCRSRYCQWQQQPSWPDRPLLQRSGCGACLSVRRSSCSARPPSTRCVPVPPRRSR
jgi:hypothetical protein